MILAEVLHSINNLGMNQIEYDRSWNEITHLVQMLILYFDWPRNSNEYFAPFWFIGIEDVMQENVLF